MGKIKVALLAILFAAGVSMLAWCPSPSLANDPHQQQPKQPAPEQPRVAAPVTQGNDQSVHVDGGSRARDILTAAVVGAVAVGFVWHFSRPPDSAEKPVEFGVRVRSVER